MRSRNAGSGFLASRAGFPGAIAGLLQPYDPATEEAAAVEKLQGRSRAFNEPGAGGWDHG